MHTPRLLLFGLVLVACSDTATKDEGTTGTRAGPGDSGDPVDPDIDADGDGVPASVDCDDADAEVFPGAPEVCNNIDDDCDDAVDEGVLETFYNDNDGDGWGNPLLSVEACTAPEGSVSDGTDCDDTDPEIFPGAVDVCNNIDDDCDDEIDEDGSETIYADLDGDGWGDDEAPGTGCPDDGWASEGGDCDDTDGLISPGQPTDYCDGKDTDCDGTIDEDSKAGWSLLTIDTSRGSVFEIDPSTAATSVVSSVDTAENINTMDVSENGVSIVHVNTMGILATFDPCTGTWTELGAHGLTEGMGGIGFGPAGRLFGIGQADVLYEFDLATGEGSVVGPLGINVGTSGLAWDCTTQTMYGADGNGDRVFEVDLTTGAATNVQNTTVPFGSVGLEFDRASGMLLGSTGSSLYTIDPTNGQSTYVGPLAATSSADDLAWHPACP